MHKGISSLRTLRTLLP